MDFLQEGIRWLHVIPGFIGLTAFWVPIFVKKGGKRHIFFGKIFLYCAYIVLASAFVSVTLRLVDLRAAGLGIDDRPESYGFLLFLAYLALVTFIIVRHAIGVLRTKRNPEALRTWFNIFSAYLAMAASIAVIAFALIVKPGNMIILLALSPVGLGSGRQILVYLKKPLPSPRQWLYEHLGGMLGAGIAFHTAFAVFGSTRIFEFQLPGVWKVVPWILPAALGIPASFFWTRFYQKKFGELKAVA